jgi:phycobilisome rod-core linker protein
MVPKGQWLTAMALCHISNKNFICFLVLRRFYMSLALLSYNPSSQNQRVAGYEVFGDEQPRIYDLEHMLSGGELDSLIQSAYRQIYNEQQMLSSNRQQVLESQLRAGQINVKDFICGLVLSDSFRRLVYDCNNNYRFVQICIQRVLGREVYNDREKMAWSIVLATKGLNGFIDQLVNSEEYLSNFGTNVVPHQRRRILPGQVIGKIPFTQMARYDQYHLAKLPTSSWQGQGTSRLDYTRWAWQKTPPAILGQVGKVITFGGAALIVLLFVAILLGL